MTDDIHSCSYYCDRPECIKRQRDELREQVEKLNAERDAWRKLVVEHNAIVDDRKHRIVWPDQNLWPESYRIDIPPELEQP